MATSTKDNKDLEKVEATIASNSNQQLETLLKKIDALEAKVKAQESEQKRARMESLNSMSLMNTSFSSHSISQSEIDKEDYLEQPAFFFAFCLGTTVFDDKRYGRIVETPYGTPIRFTPEFRHNKGREGSRDSVFVTVSKAVVYSKREADFLRNHSLFGIKIFENLKEVSGIDNEYAEVLSEVGAWINNLNDVSVINLAKVAGIPVNTSDLKSIRKKLVYHETDKRVKSPKKLAVNAFPANVDPNTDFGREVVYASQEKRQSVESSKVY